MKYIPYSEYGRPVLELTRRNLTTLLDKLDDPASARTLVSGDNAVAVRSVEDDGHYVSSSRYGCPIVELTRHILTDLSGKLDDPTSERAVMPSDDAVIVRPVEDDEHYADRPPGEVYMPTSGETR